MATTLEMLLALLDKGGLPPVPDPAKPVGIPLAPVGNLGPLSNDTTAAFAAQNPEPVPPQITQPAAPDQNFVNQYAGPAPTRPVPDNPSTLQKIAAVLGGIGGGPEFAQQLRAEREAPIRRYEQEQRGYEQRRTQGIELAERRAERQAAQENRALEQQYENDFKKWLAKNSDRSDEAKERTRQAFIRERDARAERHEVQRELEREQRAKEADAKARTGRFFTATKNMALSTELGRHYAGLSDAPLSPAAARLDAKLAGVGEVRMGRALGGGGGTGSGSGPSSVVQNTLAEFETLKQMAIQGVKGVGGTPQDEIEAVRKATSGVVRKMARQPRLFDVGTGQYGYPYAQPRGGAPAPAGVLQGPIIPPEMKRTAGPSSEEVKAYAKRFKLSPKKAREELMSQ